MPRAAALWRTVRDQRALLAARPKALSEGPLLVGGENVADPAFELAERRLVAECLATTDLFIDVGANVGLYTAIARAKGVPVIAIEPHPVNVQYLHRTLSANGWSDVEVWPVGVGRSAGSAPLYGGATGASVVRGWGGVSDVYAQRVGITTLDTLLARRFDGQRLFIKIDIEGAEYDALRGAEETRHRTPRPRWLVEITLDENRATPNEHFVDTFDLFFHAGYRAFLVSRELQEVTRQDAVAWQSAGTIPGDARNFLFSESQP